MRKMMMTMTLALGFCAHAQTNFHTNVTNLWYQGPKSNVLAIAEARLTQNTNDIAGLILRMEYHIAFGVLSEMSNSFLRVIQVGDTIKTPHFTATFPSKRKNLLFMLDAIAECPLSPEEIVVEQAKGHINEKPMPDRLIKALQMDGYFD